MQEIHGIRNVPKAADSAFRDTQDVTVADADGRGILLRLSDCSHGVRLTPEEARWLAQQLIGAALRAERQETTP